MIVQLDGVSEPVLRQAIMAGQAPTLARWLSDGTHQLRPWWATIPSTTPASTAALLYGEQQTIPAFRWWDRQTRGLLVANRPADAAVIGARLPAERGLPREGGIAVSTAFSGAAAQIYLVFSTALKRKALGRGDTFIPLFASPFLLPGVVLLTLGEMVKETYQSRRQRQRQVTPRIARKPTFVALRALTNVALPTPRARHPPRAADAASAQCRLRFPHPHRRAGCLVRWRHRTLPRAGRPRRDGRPADRPGARAIAGWGPRLSPGHLGPDEAAEAIARVCARHTIAIHHATLRPAGWPAGRRAWMTAPLARFAEVLPRRSDSVLHRLTCGE